MEALKISVSVPRFETEMDGTKPLTHFLILIEAEGRKWQLKHRFSRFADLHTALKKHIGALPRFPNKTLFTPKAFDELEKRRTQLDEYLKKLSQKTDVYSNEKFLDFLEFHRNVDSFGINQLNLIGKVTHSQMGFRDVILLYEKKIFFSIVSEMSAVSRIDSYLMNLNMPWDSPKQKPLLSVGLLEAWAQVKKANEQYTYERMWHKKYNSQVICMDFSEKMGFLVVGLDNGLMYAVQVDKNDPAKTTDLFEMKIHKGRVMSIHIDAANRIVYSIGEDKAFIKTSLDHQRILTRRQLFDI